MPSEQEETARPVRQAGRMEYEPEASLESLDREICFSEEEVGLYQRIVEVISERQRARLLTLRKIIMADGVSGSKMVTDDITASNDLQYAGAVKVTENLEITRKNQRGSGDCRDVGRDLSRIELIQAGKRLKDQMKDLDRRYRLNKRALIYTSEFLK